MSNIFNPYNVDTVYSNIDYNQAEYQQNVSNAEVKSELKNSFNKQYQLDLIDGFPNKSLGDGIGVYNQIRNKDEDAFIRYLYRLNPIGNEFIKENFGQDYLKADQILDYSLQRGNITNIFNGTDIPGMPFVMLPRDNGDQHRIYGRLMVNAVPNSGNKLIVSQLAINTYRTESGDTEANAIPVPADYATTPIRLTFSSKYSPLLVAGNMSCQPLTGDCAKGYRKLTFIKPRKSADVSALTPNYGTYGLSGDDQVMHGWVKDTVLNSDGTFTLEILIGVTRSSSTGSATTFDKNLPFAIEVGDLIEFGNVEVATECVPEVCCAKASPRIYSYCSSTKEAVGCVFEDSKLEKYTHKINELTYVQRATYESYQKMRDFLLNLGNTILEDRPNYGQNNRMPIEIPGSNPTSYTYNEYTSIPSGTKGIIPMIDDFGFTIHHTVSSLHDTTGSFVLYQALEDRINTQQASRISQDGSAIIWGQVKGLRQLINNERPYENVIPNTYEEAMDIQRGKALSFSPKAKSMYGNYYDAKEPAGGDVNKIVIAGKQIKTLHCETHAQKHPDTLYFGFTNAWMAFGPDIEGIEKNMFGMNPYFPATGKPGLLIPYIYSQDLNPTLSNGKVEYKTNKNCRFKLNAYIQFGIHTKAEYVPHQGKIKFSEKAPNPLFDPSTAESASNPRFIYRSLKALGDPYYIAERNLAESRHQFEYNA